MSAPGHADRRAGQSPRECGPRASGQSPPTSARLVEIASHSATAAQWNQAEYLKLFAIDEPEPNPKPIPRSSIRRASPSPALRW